MGLIVSKIFVIFVYLAVGFVCNRLGVLPNSSIKPLTALMINVTAPCLMISAVNEQEILEGMAINTVLAFAIALLLFWFISAVMLRINKRLGLAYSNELAVSMSGSNCGFMGFPISLALFGNLTGYYVMIGSLALNVYLYVITIRHYHYGETREKSSSDKVNIKSVLKPFMNIATIVSIVAIIMLFAEIHIPAYPISIVKSIGDITIPMSMIITGIQLGNSKLAKLFLEKSLLFTTFIKLVAAPCLTFAILLLLRLDNMLSIAMVSTMMFPTAVVSVAIAANEGKNSQIIAEAVALTTLLSMITIAIWAIILTSVFK